jgi:hypothetical protein
LITLSARARTLGGIVMPICFARLDIYHQLKLRGLLYWKIGWLSALQDFVYIVCDAPIQKM